MLNCYPWFAIKHLPWPQTGRKQRVSKEKKYKLWGSQQRYFSWNLLRSLRSEILKYIFYSAYDILSESQADAHRSAASTGHIHRVHDHHRVGRIIVMRFYIHNECTRWWSLLFSSRLIHFSYFSFATSGDHEKRPMKLCVFSRWLECYFSQSVFDLFKFRLIQRPLPLPPML